MVNELPPIDTCALAIQLGATFVARSFSGDKKQLSALLKAAISHRGTVMLDIISPCVTFNDHEGSTKSYGYMKDHEEPLHDIYFVPYFQEIEVEMAPGEVRDVTLHDGSHVRLRKLAEDHDPANKMEALRLLEETNSRGEVLTGLLYLETNRPDFLQLLHVTDEPLATLPESRVRPPESALLEIMEELR